MVKRIGKWLAVSLLFSVIGVSALLICRRSAIRSVPRGLPTATTIKPGV